MWDLRVEDITMRDDAMHFMRPPPKLQISLPQFENDLVPPGEHNAPSASCSAEAT